jgi:hypothetical protein
VNDSSWISTAPGAAHSGNVFEHGHSRLNTSLSFEVRLPARSFDVRRRGQNPGASEADER